MKPSKLPKNKMISLRINDAVKALLVKRGFKFQERFDALIDKELSKIEFEKVTTVEIKDTTKKN